MNEGGKLPMYISNTPIGAFLYSLTFIVNLRKLVAEGIRVESNAIHSTQPLNGWIAANPRYYKFNG